MLNEVFRSASMYGMFTVLSAEKSCTSFCLSWTVANILMQNKGSNSAHNSKYLSISDYFFCETPTAVQLKGDCYMLLMTFAFNWSRILKCEDQRSPNIRFHHRYTNTDIILKFQLISTFFWLRARSIVRWCRSIFPVVIVSRGVCGKPFNVSLEGGQQVKFRRMSRSSDEEESLEIWKKKFEFSLAYPISKIKKIPKSWNPSLDWYDDVIFNIVCGLVSCL